MKVLAIGSLVSPLTEAERERILSREVPHTLQLYLDGVIEQFWFRQDQPGPVFIFNAETVDQAKSIVNAMPLMVEGRATYQFVPIGPLAPLARLIQGG
jgi:hypothetical protein